MNIKFLGSGSAFTLPSEDCSIDSCDWQSNAVVTARNGKKLLIDCGSDIRFSAFQQDLKATDFDAVYISHLHADHSGGLEWLAFNTYFNPSAERPKLYCNGNIDCHGEMQGLMKSLWSAIREGLESIQGKVVGITEYFDCFPIENSQSFEWEGIKFTPIQTVHVMAGFHIKYSYGLLIKEISEKYDHPIVFFTTDSQFCPNQILEFYRQADMIFHDCETSPFKSGVHAHYSELKTLKEDVKKKMWLYHYQPNTLKDDEVIKDGFAGFIKKGSEFDITWKNLKTKLKT
jgi:ribonuclease BN (tRNA processing enzyme)